MPLSEHLKYPHDGKIDLTAGENKLQFKLEDVSPKATEQIIVKAATLKMASILSSQEVDVNSDTQKAAWGIVLHPSSSEQTFWACVDLGSPRTITGVGFTGSVSATVQIDVGGTFMAIAQYGTLCVPSGGKDAVPLLTLSPTNGAVPLLTTSKIKLTAVSSSDKLTVTSISFQTVPTNLNAKLPGQPPFWSHPGPLTAGITTPDFSELLTQFLAESQSSNSNQDAYSIPITVHSDVIALLSSAALDIDYQIAHSLLPIGVPELKLTYGVHCFPQENGKTYRLSASLPSNAIRLKARATIRGEFEPSRLVGSEDSPMAAPEDLGDYPIDVKLLPGQALAQPFRLAQPCPTDRSARMRITAIDLSAASMDLPASILNLALQSDADGRPSGEVLLSTSVTLDPADLLDDTAALVTASAATEPALLPWISVPLPQPFVLEGSQRYWLVLQVQEGASIWHCRPEPSSREPEPSSQEEVRSLYVTRDNGFSWRIAKAQQQEALTAAMRLRYCPKTYKVPLCLRIGTGKTAKHFALDQFSPLGKVDYNFDFLGNENNGLIAYWEAAGGGSARADPEEIKIPFAFLSEAPGKLTIEEMSITYSLPPHENPSEDA